jgi:hypothetical protein
VQASPVFSFSGGKGQVFCRRTPVPKKIYFIESSKGFVHTTFDFQTGLTIMYGIKKHVENGFNTA